MYKTPDDLVASGMQLFDRYVNTLTDDLARSYFISHRARFERTLSYVPPGDGYGHAVELGATDFFQITLKSLFGYSLVSGTQMSSNIEEKICHKTFEFCGFQTQNLIVSVDLESELLPFGDGCIDLILCCEVIEHLDVDPMFMLVEFNRVCKVGGHILLTTPNSCSARNFWKIAHGYRPHFFMQYEKSRSPYRHNIEYDVPTLMTLVTAAGFEPKQIETHDVFEPTMPEIIDLLKANNFPLSHRGDGIFLSARKTSGIKDRWPQGMYV
jgi:SAM-dependent methyltransferase